MKNYGRRTDWGKQVRAHLNACAKAKQKKLATTALRGPLTDKVVVVNNGSLTLKCRPIPKIVA
jgi:hypothetical protein